MKTTGLKILSISCIMATLLSASSCGNDEPQAAADEGKVALSLNVSIGETSGAQSRAAILGSLFPSGSNGAETVYELGLWICQHEEEPSLFEAEMQGFNHIYTRLKASGLDSDYSASSTFTINEIEHSSLNISRNKAVDIYSYYPYYKGLEYKDMKPDRVPFTTGETDWMWGKTSIAAEDLSGAEVYADMKYSHAMTCLRIIITPKLNGTTLTSIKLKDKKKRLCSSGYMNLASQTLERDNISEEITVKYGRSISTSGSTFYILMPPIDDIEEGDLVMSFVYNDKQGASSFAIPTTMTNGSSVSGFKEGFCYTYKLSFDNSLTFDPVSIDETWVTNDGFTFML